ncbi:MAG: L,D-transpeptidase family protein, partial [Gammaproteobacteria bacterium]
MLALLLGLALLPGSAGAVSAGFEIEINKTARLLIVRAGQEVLRTFQVAVGRGGRGDKIMRGDRKTPIGTYRVVGYNDRSRFDTFVRLNYPNVKDAYYGLRNAVISRAEFDDIVSALREGRTPPQDTALGGAIGIHGIGEETPEKVHIHDNLDWTEGCIALRN